MWLRVCATGFHGLRGRTKYRTTNWVYIEYIIHCLQSRSQHRFGLWFFIQKPGRKYPEAAMQKKFQTRVYRVLIHRSCWRRAGAQHRKTRKKYHKGGGGCIIIFGMSQLLDNWLHVLKRTEFGSFKSELEGQLRLPILPWEGEIWCPESQHNALSACKNSTQRRCTLCGWSAWARMKSISNLDDSEKLNQRRWHGRY